MSKRYQVVIVGGGPVGMALAINLGLRGITSAVIEPRRDLSPVPKGQNLTQRTLEHFDSWGIEKELRAARLMPKGYPIGELTAYGNLMSKYWHAPAGRELVRAFYSQDNERLPQYRSEEVLRRRVEEVPEATVLYGWTAGKLQQDDRVRGTITIDKRSGTQRELSLHVVYAGGSGVVGPSTHDLRITSGLAL